MNLIDTAILWPRKVVEATTPYNLLSIDWAHSVLKWFDRSGRQICYLCDWSVDREHDGLYLAFHRFFPVSFRGRFDWVEKTSLAIHTSNPYNCALWNTGNDWRNRSKKRTAKLDPFEARVQKLFFFSLKILVLDPFWTQLRSILDPLSFFDYFWKWLLMMQKIAKIRFHQLFLFINKFQAIYFFTHIVLASLDESIRSDCKLFQNDFTFRLSL